MADPVELMLIRVTDGLPPDRKGEFEVSYMAQRKDRTTALLLSLFLGELGVDRFYLGQTGLGLLKLLTLGGLGVWWLIDLLLISSAADRHNRDVLSRLAASYSVRR